MTSQFLQPIEPKKDCGCKGHNRPMLSDAFYSNVFGEMRILNVIKGDNLVIEVEVNTDHFAGIACEDVTIIAHGVFGQWKDKPLAAVVLSPSILNANNCLAQGKLIFPPSFDYNDTNAWIKLQMLGGNNPDALTNSSLWDEKFMSNMVTFADKSSKDLKKDGIVDTTEESESEFFNFSNFGGNLSAVNTTIGLGLLLFFSPQIKQAGELLINEIKEFNK